MLTSRLLRKFLVLAALAGGLAFAVTDRRTEGAAPVCDQSVYEFCWGQGRSVTPDCECNYQSCLGIPDSECTETGQTLDYSTCMCDGGDLLPWCPPRLYEQCFNQNLSVNPFSCNCFGSDVPGGSGMPTCSFASYTWCANNSGVWQSWTCNCGFMDQNNNCTASTAVRDSCTNSGGAWNVANCYCDY